MSTAQSEYLARLYTTDDGFAELLRQNPSISVEGNSVVIGRVDAEKLRTFFTEKLAEVGFDERYAINAEGGILEELIDKFFMPEGMV